MTTITGAPLSLEVRLEGPTGEILKTVPFQLLQWKHALKLEKVGMRVSRQGKVSTHLRKGLGLKRNFPIDDLITYVEEALDAAKDAMADE
jgi:hypothetical protein